MYRLIGCFVEPCFNDRLHELESGVNFSTDDYLESYPDDVYKITIC
jgi:hypothetical protein